MIRAFMASRIREEFASSRSVRDGRNQVVFIFFHRRSIVPGSTGIRCADTLSTKGDPRL
jgi:hypothetical protein